jgi:2'-phosphotransferase
MIIVFFRLLLTKMELQLTQNPCLQAVVDPDLVPILLASEIPVVIHGTYFKNWTKIKTEGISRMNRLHIHFSPGEPGDSQVISGMRASCQLYIYIDTEKALRGKSVNS